MNYFEISKEEKSLRLKELKIIERNQTKYELCERMLEMVEDMKINGVDEENYLQIKDTIQTLSDL